MKYPIQDGCLAVLNRDGSYAQIFIGNIVLLEKGAERGKRIDIRDLPMELSHLVVFNDELEPIGAFRLERVNLDNANIVRMLKGEKKA